MRDARLSLAVLAGIASPILSWGLSLVIIAGWSGYDPIAQSISLLANAPLGWLQTAAFDPPALRGRRARGEDGNPVYAHTRRLRWSASSPNASANPTSRSRRG
jgi:hypothetical protein